MITIERVQEIFENKESNWEGDNAFKGLIIFNKYFPGKTIITGASHDEIFGPDVQECIDAGISEDDLIELAKLNWMIEDDDTFSCFV